ncbi:MAG: glycosyltransferase family 2 protein [Candidatus Cloacimonetes bacterium]|jgi:glycosyltransferase involved in cell wall biosynthesis|nr:glycosyltransferase family 2 protein [Candidatus Cloacimonadota bacterium]MDD2211136.1 glycosyltransferase family 2 protein [Candidatus Cloacimonadota bacterium]MDY0299477.1 glycosyltransferase family 2 protein [Candidatus Cloacimonadaceae bacterium]
MKLIIQIPCYNEENTIAQTVSELPKEISGISSIEYLVIDDGSTDKTIETARQAGVHHVISNGSNRGLGFTFMEGVRFCLAHGADIVVNTDGDNQYCGADIPLLVQPILSKAADIVVGCRPIKDHQEFSPFKKMMQSLGSFTLRMISKTSVRDAASGFRAFSRDTCMRLNVYSRFSYCMETLIQAGTSNLKVCSVDIRVNPKTRESRLFSNAFEHIGKSGLTMLTMFILYRPGRFFFGLGSILMSMALILGLRFVYLVYIAEATLGRTYLPSLILLSVLATLGSLSFIVGVLGEVLKYNRIISENNSYLLRRGIYDE